MILFFLIGCQRHNIVHTHGIAYLDKRQKLVILNQTNKNDVIEIFGQPATKGMTDDNLWIYIERTQTREKILKLGRNYLSKNNVLVLELNNMGVLIDKKFYNKDDMNKIKFDENSTSINYTKKSFIYTFLQSLREKIDDPLGKKRIKN